MKKLVLLFLIACTIQTNAQTKEALFDTTCKKIITYLAKGQKDRLNKYVQPGIGLYYIHRMGVMDIIEYAKQVDNEPFPQTYRASVMNENIQHPDNNLLKQIQGRVFNKKDRLAKYSCETEKWSVEGIFTNININKTDRLSSNINIWKSERTEYKTFSKQGIKKIEAAARKITITKYDLVLYLYYNNNKWWLGIIDDTEADCSA